MVVFTSPKWVPQLPPIPSSIPLNEFMLDETHGRHPFVSSCPPFTCGLSGKQYSAAQVRDRVEFLARALAIELGWHPNRGTEWDKVVCIFTINTIDTLPVMWAAHRLSGIATPVNATYRTPELIHQLKSSHAKVMFTCASLLPLAIEAADAVGLPRSRIFLIETPKESWPQLQPPLTFQTVDQLIAEGKRGPMLERQKWEAGEAVRRVAFLCFSSGTSGLPKGVMISHYNVISNVLQIRTYDYSSRSPEYHDTMLGLLPQSHIYALIVICHTGAYVGDKVVVLPSFNLDWMLNAVQVHQITALFIVPPIVVQLVKNAKRLAKYNLSSVQKIWTGAAPLGKEVAEEILRQHPTWKVLQGYGLTETATLVCGTNPEDVWLGSCGSLIPGIEARLVTPEGEEVSGYDIPGELLVRSPSVALGYLDNKTATDETFDSDGYMHTGDEAVFRRGPGGHEHVFIVDRIKELIKVKVCTPQHTLVRSKLFRLCETFDSSHSLDPLPLVNPGHQVAPAELEALLLSHPSVADAAVISSPDDAAGEVPKAFVVKSSDYSDSSSGPGKDESPQELALVLDNFVREHTARYKWLKGGIEFVESIPKSPSGKILRRLLRQLDQEKREARAKTAKL
ncbi:MAG: hypothetical protein M1819_001622 [Sarea resinae]|nr:MAG: hypothetical protein M1819_001622 [Sarea resinae]